MKLDLRKYRVTEELSLCYGETKRQTNTFDILSFIKLLEFPSFPKTNRG